MHENDHLLLAFCSCPNEEVANHIALDLINKSLAACVQIVPSIRSVYKWDGKLCDEVECQLLIKTSAHQIPALQDSILALHPYELPEIIAVPISAGLPAYLDWIMASVKDSA